MAAKKKDDREQILEHVHSIFEAYLRGDREKLRQTHRADWVGFQGPSTKVERGIEAYMRNAEQSLRNFKGTGYKLLDTEVQLFGDTAAVYYVARYDFTGPEGAARRVKLRCVDIYRCDDGAWNQAGSHITVLP